MTPLVLALPLTVRGLVQNSPANRVPSHGTHLFATTYGIDLVPVDDRGRSAPFSVRAMLRTEPPEVFVGFGAPVVAPVDGEVVAVHGDEPDHEARRSQILLAAYLLTQARRARRGWVGLAGNHVVIRTEGGVHVALAHLQHGSPTVRLGTTVRAGELIGRVGNSGNSTDPHLHLQVQTSADPTRARGLPMVFRRPDGREFLPRNGEVVQP